MFVAGLFCTARWSWRGFLDWRSILGFVGFVFVTSLIDWSTQSGLKSARAKSEQIIAEHQINSRQASSEPQSL
jgi:hypothetical protein